MEVEKTFIVIYEGNTQTLYKCVNPNVKNKEDARNYIALQDMMDMIDYLTDTLKQESQLRFEAELELNKLEDRAKRLQGQCNALYRENLKLKSNDNSYEDY